MHDNVVIDLGLCYKISKRRFSTFQECKLKASLFVSVRPSVYKMIIILCTKRDLGKYLKLYSLRNYIFMTVLT